jgi:hypothetical protein
MVGEVSFTTNWTELAMTCRNEGKTEISLVINRTCRSSASHGLSYRRRQVNRESGLNRIDPHPAAKQRQTASLGTFPRCNAHHVSSHPSNRISSLSTRSARLHPWPGTSVSSLGSCHLPVCSALSRCRRQASHSAHSR